MTVAAWLIFDDEARLDAEALNDASARVEPRLVGSAGAGDLAGKYAVPASLLDNPEYARWRPLCAALPMIEADAELLFGPPVAEDL